MATLIGVEDLWLASILQRYLQDIQTELRVKAVGEFPAEHVPGKEIDDRPQVKEALLKRDVGDIGGAHLIHSRDRAEIHDAGKALGWSSRNRGARFLVDRP